MKAVNRSIQRRTTNSRLSSPLPRVETLSVAEAVEKVLIGGDLSPLTPEQRVDYYKKVCLSIGVNQLTRPFEYILFREPGSNGVTKLQLYANKSCTEQLRKIHMVSVLDHQQTIEGEYVHVQVKVQDRTGRTDFSVGSVALFKYKDGNKLNLSGTERCNAIMKASTKAKRRATLSICGLAFLDESELENVRVVGGVTPEGRIYRYPDIPDDEPPQLVENLPHGHEPGSEKAKQAEAALKRVEEEDRKLMEEKKKKQQPTQAVENQEAKYHIEIDENSEEGPIVRGDAGEVLPMLEKFIKATWGKDEFWHVRPEDVNTIHAAGEELGFSVKVILPKSSAPSGKSEAVQGKAIPNAEAKTASQSKGAPATKTSAAPVGNSEPQLVAGVLEQCNPESGKSPRMNVLLRMETSKVGVWMSTFDTKLFPYLTAGKGQQAELIVKKNVKGDKVYTNIVGLKRVGVKEFDEDNKPVLSVHREPGTLFQK